MTAVKHLCFALALLLLLSGCGAGAEIPALTDPDTDWDHISQITLYADGYYGRSMDDPLIISDAAAIKALTGALRNTRAYRAAADGAALEGLNGLWIDFGNGVVLGMYADENYGSFAEAPGADGSACYRLPRRLCRLTRQLLEQAQ